MSGGFVYIPREGEKVAACGIVCTDFSPLEATNNFLLCGESVIACAWPALSLPIPQRYSNDSPKITLLELMKSGAMEPAVGGIDDIELIKQENAVIGISRALIGAGEGRS